MPPKSGRIHFLLKCTQNILQDTSHLGSQMSLGKFTKIEIISSIFSDHNAMRFEFNYKEKTVRNTHKWRLNSALLNNQQITEEIKQEI